MFFEKEKEDKHLLDFIHVEVCIWRLEYEAFMILSFFFFPLRMVNLLLANKVYKCTDKPRAIALDLDQMTNQKNIENL